MKIEYFERNFEQNEILGLNDMKTENYLTDEQNEKSSAIEAAAKMEKISEE